MRPDIRALVRIFLGAVCVTLATMTVLVAAALGWLPRENAVKIGAVVFIGGGILLGLVFGRGLHDSGRSKDGPDQPDR